MKPKPSKGSLKPRNGYVAAALFRKAGTHGKTRKAERHAARMAFDRGVRSGLVLSLDGCSGPIHGSGPASHQDASRCSSGGRARREEGPSRSENLSMTPPETEHDAWRQGVAQAVERMVRDHEAGGSSPLTLTRISVSQHRRRRRKNGAVAQR